MKKFFLSILGLAVAALFVGTTVFLYQKSQEPPVIYETTAPFTADIVKKKR